MAFILYIESENPRINTELYPFAFTCTASDLSHMEFVKTNITNCDILHLLSTMKLLNNTDSSFFSLFVFFLFLTTGTRTFVVRLPNCERQLQHYF